MGSCPRWWLAQSRSPSFLFRSIHLLFNLLLSWLLSGFLGIWFLLLHVFLPLPFPLPLFRRILSPLFLALLVSAFACPLFTAFLGLAFAFRHGFCM